MFSQSGLLETVFQTEQEAVPLKSQAARSSNMVRHVERGLGSCGVCKVLLEKQFVAILAVAYKWTVNTRIQSMLSLRKTHQPSVPQVFMLTVCKSLSHDRSNVHC